MEPDAPPSLPDQLPPDLNRSHEADAPAPTPPPWAGPAAVLAQEQKIGTFSGSVEQRLDAMLAYLQQSQQRPSAPLPAAPSGPPDPNADPAAYFAWMNGRIAEQDRRWTEFQETQVRTVRGQQIQRSVQTAIAAAKIDPDLSVHVEHYVASRMRDAYSQGYQADPATFVREFEAVIMGNAAKRHQASLETARQKAKAAGAGVAGKGGGGALGPLESFEVPTNLRRDGMQAIHQKAGAVLRALRAQEE